MLVSALILPLGGAADAKGRPCPDNSTTDFYVNPVVRRDGVFEPTGVNSPAYCAFPTITAALTAMDAQGIAGRIIATGAEDDPGPGQPTLQSGTAIFSDETFPLSLPVGVTLTTSDDPDLGGTGLDPTNYVVEFNDGAANALHLQGGNVKGVTLKSERSVGASAMATCGSGSSGLETVTLDGASAAGGQIDRGLDLGTGCNMIAGQLRARNFGGPGVVVAEGADLSLTLFSKVHNNGGDGLVIRGEAAISLTEFAFNGDDGILVDGSSSSEFHNNIVRDNVGNGFEVHRSAATFGGNKIYNNSRSAGWDQPQVLFVGPSDPYGVPYWTGSTDVLAYQFGPQDCDGGSNPNQIHSYNTATDPVGSSEGSVGLYASDGAVVWADNNSWRTGDEAQNVDQDASSFVDANTICTILLFLAPHPGPPVE